MAQNDDLQEGCITSIRAQTGSHDRVSVFVEGRFAFGMHRDLLLEFELAKGKHLSVEKQLKIVRRDAFFKARAVAYRYLSYRDRTALEIRRRLQRDDFAASVVDDVVRHLEKQGFIDDYKFAVAYAEGRFQSGGYGPVRVRSDLRRKGVKPALVDAALDEVFSTREEIVERAREMGKRRWDQLSREADVRKRKKKVYDYLARRGFGFDMIRRIVEKLENDL